MEEHGPGMVDADYTTLNKATLVFPPQRGKYNFLITHFQGNSINEERMCEFS